MKLIAVLLTVFIITGCTSSETITTCTGYHNGFETKNTLTALNDKVIYVSASGRITFDEFRANLNLGDIEDVKIVDYLTESLDLSGDRALKGVQRNITVEDNTFVVHTTVDLKSAKLDEIHQRQVFQFGYDTSSLKSLKLVDTINISEKEGFTCDTVEQ